jgi:hypothetical protein
MFDTSEFEPGPARIALGYANVPPMRVGDPVNDPQAGLPDNDRSHCLPVIATPVGGDHR